MNKRQIKLVIYQLITAVLAAAVAVVFAVLIAKTDGVVRITSILGLILFFVFLVLDILWLVYPLLKKRKERNNGQ